jgi:hypothetical protein
MLAFCDWKMEVDLFATVVIWTREPGCIIALTAY